MIIANTAEEEQIRALESRYSGRKKYAVIAGYDVYEDSDLLRSGQFPRPLRIFADNVGLAVERARQACQDYLNSKRERQGTSEHCLDIVSILQVRALGQVQRSLQQSA